MSITAGLVLSFEPGAAPFVDSLIDACSRFSISDDREVAMFLAQLAHESGGFRWMHEIWGPTPQQSRYDRRADLGNTKPEAIALAAAAGINVGRFYAGHGGIQITGYDNHRAYSQYVYGDDRCARDPQLLVKVPDCMLSAGWFWVTQGCQRLAAPYTDAAFEAVTRRINGGVSGLLDRQLKWIRAKELLNISS